MQENEKYEIYDNFLPADYFKQIQDVILGKEIPWTFVTQINNEHVDVDNECYFEHVVYFHEPKSHVYSLLQPLYDFLDIKSLMRIKLNCYPSKQNLVIHPPHVDAEYDHKGALIYCNTCDGFTKLHNGDEINSVSNRLLKFNPGLMHSSTNCTNSKARFTININYF